MPCACADVGEIRPINISRLDEQAPRRPEFSGAQLVCTPGILPGNEIEMDAAQIT